MCLGGLVTPHAHQNPINAPFYWNQVSFQTHHVFSPTCFALVLCFRFCGIWLSINSNVMTYCLICWKRTIYGEHDRLLASGIRQGFEFKGFAPALLIRSAPLNFFSLMGYDGHLNLKACDGIWRRNNTVGIEPRTILAHPTTSLFQACYRNELLHF